MKLKNVKQIEFFLANGDTEKVIDILLSDPRDRTKRGGEHTYSKKKKLTCFIPLNLPTLL
jgi:hypothetical protein